MKGHILLEGGAEFGGRMEEPDKRALELAGGLDAQVSIIPTAAVPDHNHRRAGQSGVRWFQRLGATRVTSLPLIDRASADQSALASALRRSRLIYILGGFPRYLAQTLAGTSSWRAILEAYATGAVIGGSSAGAMILCGHYYDPDTERIAEGLNVVPRAYLIPHHDTFGKGWAPSLVPSLPDAVFVGVDEQTGLIDDGAEGEWTIYGKGLVTIYRGGKTRTHRSGETLSL
ncbi:MAG TPA: Type 1 glutamine amidotransferase-like domain-containing protein [Thermodesulfovibrionales bacterium]|jgi:cyanophycinase|nr:Type 1 glutamine amidotransferase-like domain-containing protein [Thermodesulfovibrionales bacterium]